MKVALCSPTRLQVPFDFWRQLSALKQKLESLKYEAPFYTMAGFSLLAQARSFIASRALESLPDVLFWVDDDMIYEPAAAISLIEQAYDQQAIVGAAAAQRRTKGLTNIRFKNPRDGELVTFFEGGETFEVDAVGFGMVAVAARVFHQIGSRLADINAPDGGKMKAYFAEIIDNADWCGEDVSFCMRAAAAGCKSFVDTRHRIGHRGEYDYHIEDTLGGMPRKDSVVVKFES